MEVVRKWEWGGGGGVTESIENQAASVCSARLKLIRVGFIKIECILNQTFLVQICPTGQSVTRT